MLRWDCLLILRPMSRKGVTALLLISWVIRLPYGMAEGPFIDGVSLGQGRFAKMSMLYEKTFLRVDVLKLEIHFGPDEARQIEGLVAGTTLTPSVANSVAGIALQAQNARIHIEFVRNLSKSRFLKEARETTGRVLKAGLIQKQFYDQICSQLPVWYSFMNDRGVMKGDELFHLIKGDQLRSVYRGADGKVLMDLTQEGKDRRLAVLGSYLVQDSEFRQGLIESLFAY